MKIKTPVKSFTGAVAGVQFVNGEGKTNDPAALAYFRRHGYTLEGASEDGPESDEKDSRNAGGDEQHETSEADATSGPKSRARSTTAKK